MSPKILNTTGDVIDALGGTHKVADLMGCKSAEVVINWRRIGKFPAKHYLAFQALLAPAGYWAPASLWRQKELHSQAAE
jgi:hypothetical protein